MPAIETGLVESVDTGTAELLRFATAGSVDDGKSTLIGRLLYDSKQMLQRPARARRAGERAHAARLPRPRAADRRPARRARAGHHDRRRLPLLRRPRKRRFIIADTPGHEQYTRNMVTGASTADLALVLVDARRASSSSPSRHAFISSLLGIPHLVAVRQQDGPRRLRTRRVRRDRRGVRRRSPPVRSCLGHGEFRPIPISAAQGDNVVERSEAMPTGTTGPSLLDHPRERAHRRPTATWIDVRFPVQWVIRPPQRDHRRLPRLRGAVVAGVVQGRRRIGCCRSGRHDDRRAIDTADGAGRRGVRRRCRVTLRLEDDIDVSRGSPLVRSRVASRRSTAVRGGCLLDERAPAEAGGRYLIKQATDTVKAMVDSVDARLDLETLEPRRLRPHARAQRPRAREDRAPAAPLVFDPYTRNPRHRRFILIDEATNDTVAAGMVG